MRVIITNPDDHRSITAHVSQAQANRLITQISDADNGPIRISVQPETVEEYDAAATWRQMQGYWGRS